MSDRRSFNRRSRSLSFFRDQDRDRRSPFGQKIAGRSLSRNSILPFAGQIFQKCQSLKNENF